MEDFKPYKKEIEFQYSAQYWLSQQPTGVETEIWIVLHGYGQLSEFFLKKFQPLFDKNRLIIAPEATNYGYLKAFTGRVGANWMTKHERELAIKNNHVYLDKLLETLLENYDHQPVINVLGFSQGAATATRWVCQLKYHIFKLVLWSGGFAYDLTFDKVSVKLKDSMIFIAVGENDEFVSKEAIEKQEEFIRMMNLPVSRIFYPGGHELDFSLLVKIFEAGY